MCNGRVAGKAQAPSRRARARGRGNRKRGASLRERIPSFAEVRSGLYGGLVRRRRVVLGIALAATVAVSGVLSVRWLGSSQRFAVTAFDATGQNRLPETSLRERLEIDPPVNLFRYDTAGAAERLIKSPWVKTARVSRAFPNGLSVEIEERVPAAVALIGELYLIEADGFAFKRTTATEAAALDLIVVTGISRDAYRSDNTASRKRLAEAVALFDAWGEKPTRPLLAEIHIDAVRGFTMIPESGTPSIAVGSGTAADLELRFELFDRTWSAIDQDERLSAARIHLDTAPRPSRVAIAFTPPKHATDLKSGPNQEKKQHPWAN